MEIIVAGRQSEPLVLRSWRAQLAERHIGDAGLPGRGVEAQGVSTV